MAEPRHFLSPSIPVRCLVIGASAVEFDHLKNLLGTSIALEYCGSHQETVSYLKRGPYDLILCDYKAGDGVGLQVVHQVREAHFEIPIVFLCDHVSRERMAGSIRNKLAARTGTAAEQALLLQTILHALDTYCADRQRRKTEDMLPKLWRAVEQSGDLVMITNRDGVIEYVNPAFELLTGHSRDEIVGQNSQLLEAEQDSPYLYSTMWNTVRAGQVYRGVVITKKKEGGTFVAEKTITPLRDASGEITHFISTDRDITQHRQLTAQLQQAQKMDAIGRLAGGVAHDFNNLLMVISAYAELMLDTISSEHRLYRNVDEILKAARRASDLTRQLLAFSRKQMQSLQLLDLNQVVKDICQMLPRLIGEDIHLLVVPGKNLGCVRADPVQIEQVVMNLAANARDAMPEGGKLIIETSPVRLRGPYIQKRSMVPEGDYVMLAVTDTGQGIATEHLSHIFEPFYTTKAEGKGTGLGLATVYGIVKQNAGFIWVYSEPGLGTIFKIYLPRVQKVGRVASPPVRASEEESPTGSETILLVEDEVAVRQSEKEFLTLNGYKVLDAENGEVALQVASSYPETIHLMVTDVVMPNMSGAKLAERLIMERPEMKVLFVSGYAESTVLRMERSTSPIAFYKNLSG